MRIVRAPIPKKKNIAENVGDSSNGMKRKKDKKNKKSLQKKGKGKPKKRAQMKGGSKKQKEKSQKKTSSNSLKQVLIALYQSKEKLSKVSAKIDEALNSTSVDGEALEDCASLTVSVSLFVTYSSSVELDTIGTNTKNIAKGTTDPKEGRKL